MRYQKWFCVVDAVGPSVITVIIIFSGCCCQAQAHTSSSEEEEQRGGEPGPKGDFLRTALPSEGNPDSSPPQSWVFLDEWA